MAVNVDVNESDIKQARYHFQMPASQVSGHVLLFVIDCDRVKETWSRCVRIVTSLLCMSLSCHVRNDRIYVLLPNCLCSHSSIMFITIDTLGPIQNGSHSPEDIFKCIFLNENVSIAIRISLKFVPKGPINNIPALVQIMAWRWSGNKPLYEPKMT